MYFRRRRPARRQRGRRGEKAASAGIKHTPARGAVSRRKRERLPVMPEFKKRNLFRKENSKERKGKRKQWGEKVHAPKLNFKPPPRGTTQLRKSKRKTYSPDNRTPAHRTNRNTDTQVGDLERKREGEHKTRGAISKSKRQPEEGVPGSLLCCCTCLASEGRAFLALPLRALQMRWK